MKRMFYVAGVLAVAATMLASSAGAVWRAGGEYEPNTQEDLIRGMMWTEPDTSPSDADAFVYFNAYPTEYPVATNPNSAELGSRIQVVGAREYLAMLGVWKDCNGDGYVGQMESALWDYPAALADASICAVGGKHNDGKWIHEYLPIGPSEGNQAGNTWASYIVNDSEARVWGDFGLPTDAAAQTCPIVPPPHGTTANTGLALRWADCFAGKRVTNTINGVDPNGEAGIGFPDGNNPQNSDSVLNQDAPESLFGNPLTGETGALQLDSEEDGGAEERAFTVWDTDANGNCRGDSTQVRDPTAGESGRGSLSSVTITDPSGDGTGEPVFGADGSLTIAWTDSNGAYVTFATPAPSVDDPTGSFADGLNQTFRGFHVGGEDDTDDVEVQGDRFGTSVGGDCDTTGDDDDGDNTYSGAHQTAFFYFDDAGGSNQGGTQVVGKSNSDWQFLFDDGNAPDDVTSSDALLGPGTPSNFGVGALQLLQGPVWQSENIYVTAPQSINRNTLAIQGGLYLTFYAKVDSDLLVAFQARGSPKTYGDEACGTATSGIKGGWNCDPNEWWPDAEPSKWLVYVGTEYQFIDVDCTDGTVVRGQPPVASLALLSETGPCDDAAV